MSQTREQKSRDPQKGTRSPMEAKSEVQIDGAYILKHSFGLLFKSLQFKEFYE